jgi:hypothetical protein
MGGNDLEKKENMKEDGGLWKDVIRTEAIIGAITRFPEQTAESRWVAPSPTHRR